MYYISRPSLYFNVKEIQLTKHPLHLHDYFEIIHLLQGKVTFQLGTNLYTLNTGEYFYIPPYVPHSYKQSDDSETDAAMVSLETADANDAHTLNETELSPTAPLMRIISCCVDIFPLLQKNLLEKFPLDPVLPIEQIHPDIPYAEQRLTELTSGQNNPALISALISLILCRYLPLARLTSLNRVPMEDLTSGIIAYIATHYSDPLSLDSLAHEFGISRFKVSRIFSKVLGTNFNAYLNSLRINHASYLLTSSDLSITHIALECGFNNQQTFNRVFRKSNGCTPKEYRASYNTDDTYPELNISFPNSTLI